MVIPIIEEGVIATKRLVLVEEIRVERSPGTAKRKAAARRGVVHHDTQNRDDQ